MSYSPLKLIIMHEMLRFFNAPNVRTHERSIFAHPAVKKNVSESRMLKERAQNICAILNEKMTKASILLPENWILGPKSEIRTPTNKTPYRPSNQYVSTIRSFKNYFSVKGFKFGADANREYRA